MGKTLRIILFLGIAIIVLGGVLYSLSVPKLSMPDFAALKNSSVEVNIKLANGTKSTRRVGPTAAGWVPINQISNNVLMAIIASEDTSFYSHKGVDYHELRESIKKDLEEKRWARGASTLTQQVIKNTFLSQEKSLTRKLKEVLWAGEMEKVLSKSQILCFYANLVEFGPGIYGIGNAARYYFGKSPSEISAKEGAFLAMLLPSPVKYHAYFVKKELTVWATKRVNQILRVMNRMGYIDEDQYRVALNDSLWGEKPLSVNPDENFGGEDSEVPDPGTSGAPMVGKKRPVEEGTPSTPSTPEEDNTLEKPEQPESLAIPDPVINTNPVNE